MRESDVPYMTIDWKKATKNKKKFAKVYARNKTDKNFELKNKYKNLATKKRRKAIKHYMENEIGKDEGKNPRDFFHNFQPFISNTTIENNPNSPNTDGNVMENDVFIVFNCFADYFANVPKGNMCMIYVTRITNITQGSSL